MKRFWDIILSLLLLPVVIPLIIIFSIILIIELGELPIFSQERGLSLRKYRFTIFKLKTLKSSEVTAQKLSSRNNILQSPGLYSSVPKFARWLRRTGLDELPQIFNILFGQMSFIGPRPLMLADLNEIKNEYPHYYDMRNRLTSKPGLSGVWQIFCNREEGVKNLIALDTVYEELRSVRLDIKLLLFTIPVVLTGSNADSILMNGFFPLKNMLGLNNSTQISLSRNSFNATNDANKADEDDYKVTIPGGWWYKSNSYSPIIKKNVKIIPLNKNARKSA